MQARGLPAVPGKSNPGDRCGQELHERRLIIGGGVEPEAGGKGWEA